MADGGFLDVGDGHRVAYDVAGDGLPAVVLHNTTAHLIADLERLRKHLDIHKWLLFGGSWGATLAVAYAQAHPQRVAGLVLRGVFLGQECELDWFYRGGAARFFPEEWETLCALLAPGIDVITGYHQLLHSPLPAWRTTISATAAICSPASCSPVHRGWPSSTVSSWPGATT